MSKLQGEILTLPKMSGSVSTHKSLSGTVGAKTINVGGLVKVDPTLTVEGDAADAKAVGNALETIYKTLSSSTS